MTMQQPLDRAGRWRSNSSSSSSEPPRSKRGGKFSSEELTRLCGVELFAELNPGEWAQICGALRRVWVPAGTTVLPLGVEPDGLYVLLSGTCQVWLDAGGARRLIAEARAGDVIGEISLLAQSPRMMSVESKRDCVLAWLPAQWFEAHVHELPGVLLRLARLAALRAHNPLRPRAQLGPTARTLTLRAIGGGVELAPVCAVLEAALRRLGSVALVDYARYATARDHADPTTNYLNELEEQHDYVIYVDGEEDGDWRERCARQADRLVLVGMGERSPSLSLNLDSASAAQHPGKVAPTLLLIQPDHLQQASGTRAWLDALAQVEQVEQVYHLRLGVRQDAERVARLLTGQAIGVAISGASARGVAHYGLLEVLEQQDVPIDIIAGNSSGALIAACVSAGYSLREAAALGGVCINAGRPRLRELGPPLVSLASGRGMSAALRAALGDRRAEDQFIPVIMTAVDLGRGVPVEITRGELWWGVRASCSLPGYWPPVVEDGRVLIDGGILANLPLEPLERTCAGGLLIASDLDTASEDFNAFPAPYESGAVLSGWRALLTPWRSYPWLTSVLMHAMSLNSYAHHSRALARASEPNMLFVRMDIPFSSFFGVSRSEVPQLVARGRAQAEPTITAAWPAHCARLGQPTRARHASTPVPAPAQSLVDARAPSFTLVFAALLVALAAWAGSDLARVDAPHDPQPPAIHE